MSPLDALWHWLNLTAPLIATGCMTAAMAKVFWQRELRAFDLLRLCTGATVTAALGFALTIALIGEDGRIAAYAVMVLGSAMSIWRALLKAAST